MNGDENNGVTSLNFQFMCETILGLNSFSKPNKEFDMNQETTQ